MTRVVLKSFVAAFLALLISAGQVCACTAKAHSDDAAATEMDLHEGGGHHPAQHHATAEQHDHQGNAPGLACSHCSQGPFVKASTLADLGASLTAPLSFAKFIAVEDVISPIFKNALSPAKKFFALHDPPRRTPVSLKTRLLN